MGAHARYVVLAAATVASLSCGLNYSFSAYAPQLATRLALTSTQTNAVGAAGNMGVYLSSPFIGRIVDRRGPKPTLVFAAFALTAGYFIIRAFYLAGTAEGGLFERFGLPGLVAAELLTGMGSTAGLSSAGNSVAKSFRKRRAAALSVVLSGFGLSAFLYSTLSSLFLHPRHRSSSSRPSSSLSEFLALKERAQEYDLTSDFLLLLALGSLVSMLVGLAFVRPVLREAEAVKDASTTVGEEEEEVDAESVAAEIDTERPGSLPSARASPERTPLLRSQSSKSTSSVVPDRNITGLALLRELDFYLIFLFNGLCAGVGLCYINNLGTVVRALSPSSPSVPNSAILQSRLVSLLSIFNCLGRLFSGFGSDYLLHHRLLPLPRVFWLPLTASLLLSSQLAALAVSSPRALWIPTALTGLAHGCLFGLSGIIGLERFGIKSWSQTNGVLALAPAVFGQSTNLLFGTIYDSRAVLVGKARYTPAFWMTSGMALCAVGTGAWLAGGREEMRRRAG
ncbi:putative transporter mch1 [Rhodotorula toruloides]|nr:putative transporter mch1 [Rhodotorula toruloides]